MQNYASSFQREDNEEEMHRLLLTVALPLAERAGDSNRLGIIYKNIGLVYLNQFDFAAAQAYLEKAVTFLQNDSPQIDHLIEAYGLAAKNAISSGQDSMAGYWLRRQEAALAPYPNSEQYLHYHTTAALYYRKTARYGAAHRHLEAAFDLARRLGQPLYPIYFQLHKLYAGQGLYPQALQALQEVHKRYHSGWLSDLRLHAQAFYQTYEKLGDYRNAYRWMEEFVTLQDSFYQQRIAENMAQLEVAYQTAQRRQHIEHLEAQQRRAEWQMSHARLLNGLLAAGAGLLLLTIGFLVYYFRNRIRRNRQHLQRLKSEKELAQATALLEGADHERRRLARELHDGLGGRLAGIRIKLSHLARQRKDQVLEQTLGQMDEAIHELRTVARDLMPESLVRNGLDDALQDLCSAADTPETRVYYESFELAESRLDAATRLVIYRLVQEALSNALRHAHARHILVQCSQNNSTLTVVVEDDGRGMADEAEKPAGLGLSNMEARAASLHAQVHFRSAPGKGTTVTIEIPLPNHVPAARYC